MRAHSDQTTIPFENVEAAFLEHGTNLAPAEATENAEGCTPLDSTRSVVSAEIIKDALATKPKPKTVEIIVYLDEDYRDQLAAIVFEIQDFPIVANRNIDVDQENMTLRVTLWDADKNFGGNFDQFQNCLGEIIENFNFEKVDAK